MLVQLSDPALVSDLVGFLRRAGCTAQADDEATIIVSVPEAAREDAAQLEFDLYLRVWAALHPGARASRLAPERGMLAED